MSIEYVAGSAFEVIDEIFVRSAALEGSRPWQLPDGLVAWWSQVDTQDIECVELYFGLLGIKSLNFFN